MDHENNPLNLKDRAPRQGEQFTEPRIGGLYPIAGTFAAGLILGGLAVVAVLA